MRVGIVSIYYNAFNYGAQLQARALVQIVKEYGYECEQICYDATDEKYPFEKSIKEKIKEQGLIYLMVSKFRYVVHGINVKQNNKKISNKISARKNKFHKYENKTAHSQRIYNKETISDCNDLYQRKAGVILSYAGQLTKILISIIYTPIMLRLLGQSEYGALYSYFLISYGYMRLYEKIKNLIVLVDDAQEEALSYNKNLKLNIHKLYNPTFIKNREINCAHVEELKQKYGKFVLMVSRFEYPHKDQYTVAKMLDIVRKKYHEDLDLVFVGDGPDEESVKKYVITLSQDTQEHIHFEGSRFDVQDYYKAAFLLVHASVAGEGLPTIMIEAMSYRLPMVVTDSKTGPREILGENEYGLLCRVKDPEDMANKVKKIASDPDLYNHYVLKSDERIKDFSPDVIKERLKSILEEVEEN